MVSGLLSRLRRLMPPGGHAFAGLVLLAVAATAMAIANSPLDQPWQALLDRSLLPGNGQPLLLTPRAAINEGLMAVFFFAIGLEIKREVLVGDLAHAPTRRLPVLAAAAGMAGPALVFWLVAHLLGPAAHAAPGTTPILRGWAIPAATDIAFALGVLGLLGRRVPTSLRLFLLTVAVVDDLGATAIIALAYAGPVKWAWLAAGGLVLAALAGLNVGGVRRAWPYVLLAVVLWACVLASGLHPTVAGVLAALCVPMAPGRRPPPHSPAHSPTRAPAHHAANHPARHSLLLRMEHALSPWSAFAIVPLFALANAGVALNGGAMGDAFPPLTLAVAAGLVLGKPAGICGAVWLAGRLGLAPPPRGASALQIAGVGLLCGMGFTMSLLIATLAFPQAPALAAQARAGIMGGSLISALLGFAVLWRAGGRAPG